AAVSTSCRRALVLRESSVSEQEFPFVDGRAWGRKWAALPWGVECRLLAIGGASFAVSPVRALSWVRAAHALCLVCLVASFDGLRGGWWRAWASSTSRRRESSPVSCAAVS